MRRCIREAIHVFLYCVQALGLLTLALILVLALGWRFSSSQRLAPTEADRQCEAALKAALDSPVCSQIPPRAPYWETVCEPWTNHERK
jgi:hypothetical protein